jgi:hypothetical protein
MTSLGAIRDWWNGLSESQREAEARHLLEGPDLYMNWDAPWERLDILRQQARLRLYYEEMLVDSRGHKLRPLTKPLVPGDDNLAF